MSNEIMQVLNDLKNGLPALAEKVEAAHKRVDAIESKSFPVPMQGRGRTEDGIDVFVKKFAEARNEFDRSRRIVLTVPSLLTKTLTSTGLTVPDVASGVSGAGRFPYSLRSVFRSVPAESGSVFTVRSTVESTSPTSQASEGSDKAESSYTLTGETVGIPTLAHWTTVSKQAMDDVIGLGEFLRSTLLWGLARELERQIFAGDGNSGNMEGLTVDAQTFDETILTASNGWEIADLLAAAACQLEEDGYTPDFFVVSPRTWMRAITTKATDGQYIVGGPQSAVTRQMWNMRAVVSDQLTADQFLVGDSTAALIRPRSEAVIDVSDSHASNFIQNKLTLRAEERCVLQKLRPDAFVYRGSTATSPA
jgi:HK97 family phage major capsid protein